MKQEDLMLVMLTLLLVLLCGAIHIGLQYGLELDPAIGIAQLAGVYAMFGVYALIMILALVFVNVNHKHQVGFAFLVLSAIQMVLAFLIARRMFPDAEGFTGGKGSFFAVFAIFLTLETVIAIRLLNRPKAD